MLCLGKIFENPESNDAWEQRLGWLKSSSEYRNFDRIDGEPMEFEWNIFPGFNALQLSDEVKGLLLKLGETPENFTGRILFMSMFNDIFCGTRKRKIMSGKCQVRISVREKFGKGQWSLLVLVLQKSGTVSVKIVHRMLLEIAERRCPIFRATSPLSRGRLQSKGHGKLSIHFAADQETIETIFRIILSANQLSLHGAVAEMCEEYESFHERRERPVVGGQSSSSFVLSAIKTEVLLDSDDPANQDLLLQQYGERIERLSKQDKFMTKDTADLSQFRAVTCREYTLPREEPASQPKGWIQGNTTIGPVFEVATSYLHCENGVEIRIMSMNKDNSHSWVRLSHGSNKLVTDLSNKDQDDYEQETSGDQLDL